MWKLAQYQINQAITDHIRWLESDRKMGRRLCIIGYDLTNLDLSNTNLQYAFFEDCRLNNVNLTNTNLSRVILHTCDLTGAKIRGTNLEDTEFYKTDITKAVGLSSTKAAMDKFFGNDGSGYIVYKVFNMYYPPDPNWIIAPGSIIDDPLFNNDRTKRCGRGIDCGTMNYIRKKISGEWTVWKCRIPNELVRDSMVCVPYSSSGDLRCRKLELLNIINL